MKIKIKSNVRSGQAVKVEVALNQSASREQYRAVASAPIKPGQTRNCDGIRPLGH